MDYQTILSEVESWPLDDRIRLVEDVWDRLVDQGYEPELTEEMKAELDRRSGSWTATPSWGCPGKRSKPAS